MCVYWQIFLYVLTETYIAVGIKAGDPIWFADPQSEESILWYNMLLQVSR